MNVEHSILALVILSSSIFQSCRGQSPNSSITLKDIKFSSIFGQSEKDSLHMYCLLGTGYFRASRSDNSDSLIDIWIGQHLNARVIPVSSFGPTMTDYPNSKLTYCWLVDGKDTINNYLVKNGCYAGGTMMRPQTKAEMSKQMKEIYKDLNDAVVHIDKKAYDEFIEQIKADEIFARENKLGIWKNKSGE
jgi:hypothetical protein